MGNGQALLASLPVWGDAPVLRVVRLQFADSDFCAFALAGSALSRDNSCSGSRNSTELTVRLCEGEGLLTEKNPNDLTLTAACQGQNMGSGLLEVRGSLSTVTTRH